MERALEAVRERILIFIHTSEGQAVHLDYWISSLGSPACCMTK